MSSSGVKGEIKLSSNLVKGVRREMRASLSQSVTQIRSRCGGARRQQEGNKKEED